MLRGRLLSRRLSTAALPEVASAARFAARLDAALKSAPSAADLRTLQQQPMLTRTSRGLRTVRTGYAY